MTMRAMVLVRRRGDRRNELNEKGSKGSWVRRHSGQCCPHCRLALEPLEIVLALVGLG